MDEKIYNALVEFVESTGDSWNYVTPVELEKMDKEKLFLLDIRKPEDYEKEHIKGTENIFWMDLLDEKNLKRLPKDRKIVLICYVGHTSSQALVILRLLGYDAVGLKFGMGRSPVEGVPVAGWLDYGFETVRETSRIARIAARVVAEEEYIYYLGMGVLDDKNTKIGPFRTEEQAMRIATLHTGKNEHHVFVERYSPEEVESLKQEGRKFIKPERYRKWMIWGQSPATFSEMVEHLAEHSRQVPGIKHVFP